MNVRLAGFGGPAGFARDLEALGTAGAPEAATAEEGKPLCPQFTLYLLKC